MKISGFKWPGRFATLVEIIFSCSRSIKLCVIHMSMVNVIIIMCLFSVTGEICNDKYPECRRTGGTGDFDREHKIVIWNCKLGVAFHTSTSYQSDCKRNYKTGHNIRHCTQKYNAISNLSMNVISTPNVF